MCGKAGCLCAWVQTGPGTGSRPENTRLIIIILGLRPSWQHPHNSPGKHLRILPLPWTCFPSGSLFHQPQGSILHVCVLTDTLSSLQDTGSQARVKGAAALTRWVSSKVAGKSHRKRSLTGYSSWGWKESDMTEPVGMRTRCFHQSDGSKHHWLST